MAKEPAKDAKKPVKKKRKSPARLVKETVAELKKVNWPARKELVQSTILVIVIVIIAAIVTGAMDFVFTEGLRLLGGTGF